MHPVTKLRRQLFDPLWGWLKANTAGWSWRPAAEANRLTRIRESTFLWTTTAVEGWLDSLRVGIQAAPGHHGRAPVRITVSGVARELTVRMEGFDTRLQKRLRLGTDVETGDASFDEALFISSGHAPLIHALFDADTRRALLQLFGGGVEDVLGTGTLPARPSLAAGELIVDLLPDEVDEHMAGVLKGILDLARRLVEPADLGARIARNALEDRAERVRRQCLLMLAGSYADHPATRETLRRACADASEEVRLEAALALQHEGHLILRILASSAESESCAARAIAALGEHLEPAEALAVLDASLLGRRLTVAAACVAALGGRGGARTGAALERVLAEEAGALAIAAARALGQPGLEGAEAALIRRGLLHAEEGVRVAAAAALARTGTVSAVLPLQEAAQREGGALGRAARLAMAEIQSRLSGAEPGQLTVTGAEGGTVTLATEGGEVSLPGPPETPAHRS